MFAPRNLADVFDRLVCGHYPRFRHNFDRGPAPGHLALARQDRRPDRPWFVDLHADFYGPADDLSRQTGRAAGGMPAIDHEVVGITLGAALKPARAGRGGHRPELRQSPGSAREHASAEQRIELTLR